MLNTMDFDFVAATLDKYGLSDRFDAGQICGKGWTGVKGQCKREKKIIRNKDGRRRYSNKVAMGRLLFPDIALAHDIIKRRKPDLLAGVKTDSAQQLADRFDAKKVLLKMGGRRPGKRCKKGWIAAEKQCSDHKTADGKLTAEGKQSARELASRVRDRKGLSDTMAVKVARMPLREFLEPIKGVHTEKQLAPMFRKHHKEVRSELNKRRINSGREAIVDKKAPRSPKSSSVNPEYKDLKGPQIKAAKLLAKDILADPQKEKTVAAALREHAGKAQKESLSPEQRQASMDLHGIYSTAFAIVDKKRIANMKYSNRNRKDSSTPTQQTSRVRRLNR